MNQEDDPEARIRELEQPLADRARASELSEGGNYSYPPPPGPVPPGAPPGYGGYGPPGSGPAGPSYNYNSNYGGTFGAFPGVAPRSSGGRWFWIVAGVIVVGVLILVGGIAAFAASRFSRDDIAGPSVTQDSSTTAPPGTTSRGPTPSTGKTRTTTPSTSTAPSGAPLTVSGVNENRTVACSDNVVTVSGISNTVVITGHCASVKVSGLNNVITIDAADSIDASGLGNKVTYHSGSPKISKFGDDNEIVQG